MPALGGLIGRPRVRRAAVRHGVVRADVIGGGNGAAVRGGTGVRPGVPHDFEDFRVRDPLQRRLPVVGRLSEDCRPPAGRDDPGPERQLVGVIADPALSNVLAHVHDMLFVVLAREADDRKGGPRRRRDEIEQAPDVVAKIGFKVVDATARGPLCQDPRQIRAQVTVGMLGEPFIEKGIARRGRSGGCRRCGCSSRSRRRQWSGGRWRRGDRWLAVERRGQLRWLPAFSLLNDVRQLVCQEPTALGCLRSVFTLRKCDVRPQCERPCLDRASHACRRSVRVQADAAQIDSEARLEEGARRFRQRLSVCLQRSDAGLELPWHIGHEQGAGRSGRGPL